MYKDGTYLRIGATTGEKHSGFIADSLIWGEYHIYLNDRGGFAIADPHDNACRFEIDVRDHTFVNIGTIFNPISLRFFTKSRDESSMVIDKNTGTVIIGKNVDTPNRQDRVFEVHGKMEVYGELWINGHRIV